jgi:hypothetical protein
LKGALSIIGILSLRSRGFRFFPAAASTYRTCAAHFHAASDSFITAVMPSDEHAFVPILGFSGRARLDPDHGLRGPVVPS